jgi:hypothetical protein
MSRLSALLLIDRAVKHRPLLVRLEADDDRIAVWRDVLAPAVTSILPGLAPRAHSSRKDGWPS